MKSFISWYSGTRGYGIFTYHRENVGFILYADDINQMSPDKIPDLNPYDEALFQIAAEAEPGSYIIGYSKEYPGALDHELAHALFYLSVPYRRAISRLLRLLDPLARETLYQQLLDATYPPQVLRDEAQAYLATGLLTGGPPDPKFRACFQKYLAKWGAQ